MSIIAILILPMMAQAHEGLATGFALGFIASGLLVLLMAWVTHWVLPDPPSDEAAPARPGFQPGYSPVAAMAALKSSIVVLPLATVFIALEWSGQALVMVFAAIFSLSPQMETGWAAGMSPWWRM